MNSFVQRRLVCSFLYLIKKRLVITMEASYSCRLTWATVLPVEEKTFLFVAKIELLPLSVRAIQQTLLIAFTSNLIEAKPLTILYPAVPEMLALEVNSIKIIWTVPYLDPTRGMPML